MYAKPQAEHRWLDQLVGQWSIYHECTMPDGTINKTPGKMTCRSLGGLWLICESSGESSEGAWSTIITLGFDPRKNCYVGTFIGSMIANVWPYHGVLDGSGNRLPLETEGPKFVGEGTCKYRDTIEILDRDHWQFNSEYQDENGTWIAFMSGRHNRIA